MFELHNLKQRMTMSCCAVADISAVEADSDDAGRTASPGGAEGDARRAIRWLRCVMMQNSDER